MAEDVKAPNFFERVKEEIAAVIMYTEKIHSKETHGTSDDIDENTPNNEVRAPTFLSEPKKRSRPSSKQFIQKRKSIKIHC